MYKLNEDKLIKFLEENEVESYNIIYPEGMDVKKAIRIDIDIHFKPSREDDYNRTHFVAHGYNDKHYLTIVYYNGTHNYRISEELFEKILELKPNSEFLDSGILDQICDKTKDIEEKQHE